MLENQRTISLEGFQDYLLTQGLSFNTVLIYSEYCQRFRKQEPTQEWVDKFVRQHNTLPARAMLKQYLRFIGKHKELEILQRRGRKKVRLQAYLTFEEVNQLAYSCKNTKFGMLVLFLFQTGLRISEALKLTRLNIDFVNLKVRGIGKGDKEFEQCITQDLADALLVYMEYHEPHQKIWSYSRETAWVLFQRRSLQHLGKKIHPHTMRHSIAMHLKKNGMVAEERAVYLNHDLSRLGATIGTYSPPDREEVHAKWRTIMAKQQN